MDSQCPTHETLNFDERFGFRGKGNMHLHETLFDSHSVQCDLNTPTSRRSASRHGVTSQAVIDQLADALNSTRPSLGEVAASLRTSSRTLRRKLHSEGVRFSDLLDRARFERAILLLLDTENSLEQIAFSLQFSSASAFRRAFKRWATVPPSHFRARAHRGP